MQGFECQAQVEGHGEIDQTLGSYAATWPRRGSGGRARASAAVPQSACTGGGLGETSPLLRGRVASDDGSAARPPARDGARADGFAGRDGFDDKIGAVFAGVWHASPARRRRQWAGHAKRHFCQHHTMPADIIQRSDCRRRGNTGMQLKAISLQRDVYDRRITAKQNISAMPAYCELNLFQYAIDADNGASHNT